MRIEQNRVQNSKNEEFFSVMPSARVSLYYIVLENLKIGELRIDALNPEKNQFIHFWSNLISVLNPLML
jgi:hypothetical protein